MSETKIKVPEGMLKAAKQSLQTNFGCTMDDVIKLSLKYALRWLSENPIVPTDEQIDTMMTVRPGFSNDYEKHRWFIAEWQRRMFLAPEPETIGFMECDSCRSKSGSPTLCSGCLHNRAIIEKMQRNSCPACDNGQSLERGEGTHREGTRQHPIEPKEESAYWRVVKAMGAVTLSRQDGDRILEYVRGAIHG